MGEEGVVGSEKEEEEWEYVLDCIYMFVCVFVFPLTHVEPMKACFCHAWNIKGNG